MSDTVTVRPRVVRHVSIDSGQPYERFRAACDTAFPAFGRLEAWGVVRSGAGWTGATALSDATAGNGVVNIFTFDPSPLMKLNGSTGQGVTCLGASIIRADREFGAGPASFACIPMRIMISEPEQATGQISFALAADFKAVFGRAELDGVRAGSSQRLRGPVKHLGVPVPGELTDAPAGSRVFAAAP